jgi:archaeal type IV pilus assembly protein PilA
MMGRDPAVSAVIGEILMIALVLILVPAVTISLMNQVPEDRTPTVNILMGPLDGNTIILCHKGGDWVKKSDIKIMVNSKQIEFNSSPIFDLGENISLNGINSGDEISFIVKNSVIFSGVVNS